MSTYTIQFGTLIDSGYDVGLSEYPIFEESYRTTLNKLIIGRYRFREIGAETAALFRHYFLQTLCEIMPYYNQLYESARMKFDPLHDVDFTETTSGTSYGSSTAQSGTSDSSKSKQTNAESDTPQNTFNFSDVSANKFLSEAGISESETQSGGTASSSGQTAGTSAGSRRMVGKTGGKSYSEMIEEYRRILLNIDRRVLDDLNDCFMNIW